LTSALSEDRGTDRHARCQQGAGGRQNRAAKRHAALHVFFDPDDDDLRSGVSTVSSSTLPSVADYLRLLPHLFALPPPGERFLPVMISPTPKDDPLGVTRAAASLHRGHATCAGNLHRDDPTQDHESDKHDERYLEHVVIPEGGIDEKSDASNDHPRKQVVFLPSSHRCPDPRKTYRQLIVAEHRSAKLRHFSDVRGRQRHAGQQQHCCSKHQCGYRLSDHRTTVARRSRKFPP